MQNALENPITAAAASGAPQSRQTNNENLLDFDFDGSAPASAAIPPAAGLSGLEGLAGTPQRVASPAVQNGGSMLGAGNNAMGDLMGLSDGMGFSDSNQDILNGFGGMDLSGTGQPPPPRQQLEHGTNNNNEDLLGLF
jgi:hypothetical protein